MIKISINTNEYIIREIDNETIILNPSNGDSHLLDLVGTIFFNAIKNNNYEIEAMEEIKNKFEDVNDETIYKDFETFVHELERKNIIRRL